MASTENMGSVDPATCYQQSFGNIPNGTVYQKVNVTNLKSLSYDVDLRPRLHEAVGVGMKALATTTGGAGTAGYAMIPIYVDPRIVDTTRKFTPLVELMPRVTNMGITADYNKLTAKGGGFTAAEDAALNETTDTYVRASSSIKYLYAIGRVTGPAIAAMPSYVLVGLQPQGGAVGAFNDASAPNAMQTEVLVKTRSIRELEEYLIIAGNATTSAATTGTGSLDPNGTEFDGIIQLMSTTNTVAKGTTALSLDDLNKAVRYAFDKGGRPNLAVCSSGVYEDILGLLTAKIGYMQPVQQVYWGFSTIVLHTMVGDIPVIPSMFMSNTSGSKAIYFLDLTVCEMRVLQDLSYQELAQTNDSKKFMLKIYETFIIKNTSFCSSVTAISG